MSVLLWKQYISSIGTCRNRVGSGLMPHRPTVPGKAGTVGLNELRFVTPSRRTSKARIRPGCIYILFLFFYLCNNKIQRTPFDDCCWFLKGARSEKCNTVRDAYLAVSRPEMTVPWASLRVMFTVSFVTALQGLQHGQRDTESTQRSYDIRVTSGNASLLGHALVAC